MRPTLLLVLAASLRVVPTAFGDPPVLAGEKDRTSYSIGASLGASVRRQGVEVDAEALVRGLRDALAGDALLVPEEEVGRIVASVHATLRQKQTEARRAGGEENKARGEAFLAENGRKEGVVTLPSGLQYQVLKAGEGPRPGNDDTVEVHFRGTLLDGTEFDNSRAKGRPETFRVNGVIAGWNEALKLMPVGSRWQVFVPPHLAYSGRGAGRLIGPFATLVFDLELIAVR